MKKFLTLLLALILVISLVSCGSGSDKDDNKDNSKVEENNDKNNNKNDGGNKGNAGILGGNSNKNEADEDYIGIWVNESFAMAFEFTNKGTCIMTDLTYGMEVVYSYTVKDDVFTLTYDGESMDMEYAVDGDTIELTAEGDTIEFEKVDSLDDYLDADLDADLDLDLDLDYDEVELDIDKDLVGEWESEDGDSVEFKKNGSCTLYDDMETLDCEWGVSDGELYIVVEGVQSSLGEYEVDGDTLTIGDGYEEILFVKK
ncbi:MAG: hypothetical protein E7575_00440 [Ruminococcaceae bacterium]|nr:hypothetical protein [Oscillospiraceae bacterium]